MTTGNRHEASNSRKAKVLGFAISALLFALSFPAAAQQTKKIPRIAYLAAGTSSSQADQLEEFRQGLRELRYIEGKNIIIEPRYAEGKLDRLPALAAELVGLKVDVIVTAGPTATRPAKEATATIPIVMAFDSDPVGSGFVTSLARPGGNITGLSSVSAELNGKRLELLKETVPSLSRVAVFGTSTNPGNAQALTDIELTAGAFGVKVQSLDIRDRNDIETAFRAARKERAGAVLVLNSPVFPSHRTQMVELAAKNRLPAISFSPAFVDAGGLMSYGVSTADLFRRAATYVDKILKGAKPADLPVEQPIKFELVINLKAAKQIGLTIPPNVLARADRVIR
jgi:putative ABC transport system substrate-binding protein